MDALHYLESVQRGLTEEVQTVNIPRQIFEDTIKLIHSNLADITYLKSCVMSEDQVRVIMSETCQQMMNKQRRIFEINGALEALTKLEVEVKDKNTLVALATLVFMYKKEIASGMEEEA